MKKIVKIARNLTLVACLATALIFPLGFVIESNALSQSNIDPSQAVSEQPRGIVPGVFTVKYANGNFETRQVNGEVNGFVTTEGLSTLATSTSEELAMETLQIAMVEALQEPDIVYVEPVYYLELEAFEPDDVIANDRWRFDATNITPIWQQIFDIYGPMVGSQNEVIVGIIDDGITTIHPDLNVVAGYDFANGDDNPSPTTGSHGNHVAGIVGAKGNNSTGSTGVYPNVSLMPLKVFKDNGEGRTEYLVSAIEYAISHNVDVINMSLSYPNYVAAVETALQHAYDAGIIIVVATGNDSDFWSDVNPYNEFNDPAHNDEGDPAIPVKMAFPAAHDTVFAVGSAQYLSTAVGAELAISDFSNIAGPITSEGKNFSATVDLIAPGSYIYSTYYDDDDPNNNITLKSGTSMATPHVAGFMALMKAQYPTLTRQQIYDAVTNTTSTAVHLPTVAGVTQQNMIGPGLMQVKGALEYYLPSQIAVKTKKGLVEDLFPITFDPLTKSYVINLTDDFTALQLDVDASVRITNIEIEGTNAVNGLSDWINIGTEPLDVTVVTSSTVGHDQTYKLTFVPPAAAANGNLSQISFSGSDIIIPVADINQTYYVPNSQEQLNLTVTPEIYVAQEKIAGTLGSSQTINLSPGLNNIAIQVISSDGSVTSDYTLKIVRESDVTLQNLSITLKDNALNVIGAPYNLTNTDFTNNLYFASYASDATKMTLTLDQSNWIKPYAISAGASNLSAQTQSTWTLDLSKPRQNYTIQLADGSNTSNYQLILDLNSAISLNLSALTLSSGSLSPAFNSGTTSYTATVPYEQTSLTVGATAADTRAQVSINGTVGTSKTVNLNVGTNTITITNIKDPAIYVGDIGISTTTLTITRSAQVVTPPVDPPPVVVPPFIPPALPPGPVVAPIENVSSVVTNPTGQVVETVTVVDSVLQGAIAAAGSTEPVVLVVKAPKDNVDQQVLAIADAVMQGLAKSNKDLVLQFEGVAATLPSSLLKEATSSLTFALSQIESAGADPSINSSLDVSPNYEFSLKKDGKAITTFDEPIEITLQYNDKLIGGTGAALGVFYWDPIKQTWSYAGGKVLKSGSIQFSANHFSTYAVKVFNESFVDVTSHWAKTAINTIASLKIANGLGNDQFAPDATLTNAQFIAFLTRLLALPESDAALAYTDLGPNAWYLKEVRSAYKAGLLKGVYTDKLQPDEPIRRDVMAALLMNAYSAATGVDKNTLLLQEVIAFTDQGQIQLAFRRDVLLARQMGLISGLPDGSYKPASSATRAEAMTVLLRLKDLF